MKSILEFYNPCKISYSKGITDNFYLRTFKTFKEFASFYIKNKKNKLSFDYIQIGKHIFTLVYYDKDNVIWQTTTKKRNTEIIYNSEYGISWFDGFLMDCNYLVFCQDLDTYEHFYWGIR